MHPLIGIYDTKLCHQRVSDHVKIWDTALRKEWDGLCEREVFEHDLTKM
jgi:hypothetical protein